ncbi:fungal specific transcription factor domain-containing protein [Trichoderma breve]|uniref:Fungal specific transcription factor domain-containing protein n=1 Tax=Trichoderma breve TaxID=2034170 RepID=A0A9W9BHF3_9HYPO|nr:fungal specific transcription factor domain-containing protein [Trichoderma breve]KAJ4862334.1 fungal specific transcription factor domain-containing protein [Trichoderma breve]
MSSAKATKKSAFSCEPCRRRKVKCGGEQPMCQRCAARNDECVYKLNPTLSYTQRLEDRIKDLEEQLAKATAATPPAAASDSKSPASSHSSPSAQQDPRQQIDDSIARSFRGLKIDDKGGITYHGTTSFFNLPSDHSSAAVAVDLHASATEVETQRRERLVSNAWQQRVLEEHSGIPEPFQTLLNVHWCWIQPLFNFIYRPAFTRDMQSLGPYYSHTLLNAVLSHSIRWAKSDPNTKRILDESYDGGAVFDHLGIHVDGERYPGSVHFSDEEVEIRHRVFWSCYFWDKIISLYLGRSPSLKHTTVSPPQIMFDDSAENELWVPFGAPPLQTAPWKYPPSTAHSASCFLSMCRLSVIFNEILIHMYDPLMQNTESEVQECLIAQEPALQQWWDELAPYLKLEPMALPNLAPPSHIVTTNCLYHTFKILLYRPMLTRRKLEDDVASHKRYLVECVTSATAIIAIFDLFCRTFTMNYCVLSLAYSVYIASSIFLLQVQAAPDDGQALERLNYCIEALKQVRTFSPVIGSAINLLNKELSAVGISLDVQDHYQPPPPPAATEFPQGSPVYQATEVPSSQPQAAHPLFHVPSTHSYGTHTMSMDPGIFEAMSSLEPLSVRVGALPNTDPQNPF